MSERTPPVGTASGGEPTIIRPRARSTVLEPGELLGHTYVIVSLLAKGGMGEVYRARHRELGTEHAIKVIRPELANDPKMVQLLIEEARKLGRVRDDAIVDYEGSSRRAGFALPRHGICRGRLASRSSPAAGWSRPRCCG